MDLPQVRQQAEGHGRSGCSLTLVCVQQRARTVAVKTGEVRSLFFCEVGRLSDSGSRGLKSATADLTYNFRFYPRIYANDTRHAFFFTLIAKKCVP